MSQQMACYYELLATVMRWGRVRGASLFQRHD